jgi:transcriptional regulator with XRE-family HTH domain
MATVTIDQANRFGDELYRWRARRRLSQLDLATRAGTTQRYVSYVERGRSAPGRAMVIRLAESLELSLRERNGLLLAAGYAPIYPRTSLDDPSLRSVRDALDSVVAGHEPYPAVIVGPYGDILGANSGMALFTLGASPELLAPPVNAFRLALHPEGMAARIENLADWGEHVLAHLRLRAERTPDASLDALIAELSGYLPRARPGSDYLGFTVPLRLRSPAGELRLITTLTSFATATDVTLAELHLEAFLPADAPTAQILHTRAWATAR